MQNHWLQRTATWLVHFLLAVMLATLLASTAHSQVNLSVLAGLGLPVDLAIRAQTTWADWLGFAPTLCVLFALALLPGFVCAGVLARRWPRWRLAFYLLAGATAIASLLVIMRSVIGLSAISATRFPLGFAFFCLSGAAAGWLQARLGQRALKGR